MATKEITEANFRSVVEQGGIVLIDWWAPWCGPCRAFAPVYESAAEKYADINITFGKVNTDEQQALASGFEIKSIPTLMIFRDRVMLFARPGAMAAAALEDLISQVQNLDMEMVRQKLSEVQGNRVGLA